MYKIQPITNATGSKISLILSDVLIWKI